jgi:hypothetical protein
MNGRNPRHRENRNNINKKQNGRNVVLLPTVWYFNQPELATAQQDEMATLTFL